MMALDPRLAYMVLVTQFAYRIEGLWAFQSAIRGLVDEASKREWLDPQLSHLENKTRMKQLGGFVFFSKELLREFSILGVAKTFEDLLVEAKDLGLPAFNIWAGDDLKLPYHYEMRCTRNLANVIKHNGSRIVVGGGEACAFLIEKAGYAPDTEVAHIEFDIERALYQTYMFLDAVAGHLTGVDVGPSLSDQDADFERFEQGVVPWFLKK